MKKIVALVVAMLVGGLFALSASAQTYPYTNPTYIPNASFPAAAIASNVAASPMTLSGIGTITLQISGTCTNLAGGALQGSVDGTNYVTLNMYANGATSAASAVTSVTATGLWTANSSGLKYVRVNNTGVTGTACIATLYGSPNAFSLPH